MQILEWLSTEPSGKHHRAIRSRVLDGTCQWVLRHEAFVRWKLERKNSLVWLHGGQGVGKSCIASTVIEDSLQASKISQNLAHAHFYCSRNTAEPQRGKAEGVLGCIASQLSRRSADQPISPLTVALYKRIQSSDGPTGTPVLRDLSDLIIGLLEPYLQTTIVIDALDECDLDERDDLLSELEYVMGGSDSLVKFFVTSREEGDLRLKIQTYSGFQVTRLENKHDIEKFVNFETDRLVAKNHLLVYIHGQAKEELKALIKKDVISKADGM